MVMANSFRWIDSKYRQEALDGWAYRKKLTGPACTKALSEAEEARR